MAIVRISRRTRELFLEVARTDGSRLIHRGGPPLVDGSAEVDFQDDVLAALRSQLLPGESEDDAIAALLEAHLRGGVAS